MLRADRDIEARLQQVLPVHNPILCVARVRDN